MRLTRSWTSRPFFAVVFVLIVVLTGANLVAPLFPIYIVAMHLSGFALTSVAAIYAVGVICSLWVMGSLSDRIGRRPILAASLITTIVASVNFAFAQDVGALLFARFLEGIAVGGVSATALAALNDLNYSGDRDYAARVGSIATTLGFGVGPIIAGILADVYPSAPRTVFFVLIAFCILSLLGMLHVPSSGKGRTKSRGPIVPANRRDVFFHVAATFVVSWASGPLFVALGPSMIVGMLRTGAHGAIGVTIFIFYVAASAGQHLARRTPAVTALQLSNALLLVGVAAAALAAELHSLPLFVAAFSIAGASQGLALLGGLTLVNDLSPVGQRGSVLSAFFLSGYIAIIVLTPAMGLIEDRVGLYGGFNVFAGTIALCALLSFIDLTVWKLTRPIRSSPVSEI